MSAVFNFLSARRRRGPLFEDEETSTPSTRPTTRLPEPARPATPIYTEPITTEPVPTTTSVSMSSPPPLTTTDRRGRPRLIEGLGTGEQLSAERELFDRLQSYEPQKRSKLRQIGMAALRGLAAGGPGGAIGGGIFGLGTALLDPEAEDRAWRDKQMEQSQRRQQVYRRQERDTLEDDLLRAQVDETKAEAEQRRNPRPKLVETVLPDGTTVLAPEREGAITGRPKASDTTYTVNVPGVGPIVAKPGEALGYYGQVERRGEERGIREGERESNYERARISLSEAEAAEKENLSQRQAMSEQLGKLRTARASLKPDPSLVTFNGQINDPNYWSQADALDAQIKDTETEVARRQRLADEAGTRARELRGELGRYGPRSTASTGRYSGKRFSRVKVHARAAELRAKGQQITDEQAEREITSNGGTIY